MANSRSPSAWKMHHKLVGEVASRVSAWVSNTQKMKLLEEMDRIESEMKKVWVENAKAKKENKQEDSNNQSGWDDLDL